MCRSYRKNPENIDIPRNNKLLLKLLYFLFKKLSNKKTSVFGTFGTLDKKCRNQRKVQNNIAFLKNGENICFKKWRATVLRSTRLIHSVLDEYKEG